VLHHVNLVVPNRPLLARILKRFRFHAPGSWRQLEDGNLSLETWLSRDVIPRIEALGAKIHVLDAPTPVSARRRADVGEGNRFATGEATSLLDLDRYLNVEEVEAAVVALAAAHPNLAEAFLLPETTHQGRTSHALRVGLHRDGSRPGLLVLGGLHAREWGSCEIALHFAASLLRAFASGTGLAWGGFGASAARVREILEGLDLFLFPLANPDGRHHSQTRNAMWRKNRRPVGSRVGVDLNRNFNFLWNHKKLFAPECVDLVATSARPRDETYRGTAPFSEAETRNVRWLLDQHPHIRCFVDLHAYGELVMHSWGDDENQVQDPSMNFLNPAFDKDRGLEGDARYREYLPAGDLQVLRDAASRFAEALRQVRGKRYEVGPSFAMYPTSGTSDDWAYSRHFRRVGRPKVYSLCVEWGTEFQPPWTEMKRIAEDISAGLVSFCGTALALGPQASPT
jgi:murein tripeptide amidase MpaA